MWRIAQAISRCTDHTPFCRDRDRGGVTTSRDLKKSQLRRRQIANIITRARARQNPSKRHRHVFFPSKRYWQGQSIASAKLFSILSATDRVQHARKKRKIQRSLAHLYFSPRHEKKRKKRKSTPFPQPPDPPPNFSSAQDFVLILHPLFLNTADLG